MPVKKQDCRIPNKRIKEHLSRYRYEIADLNKKAEELSFSDITGKDVLYTENRPVEERPG